MSILVEIVNVFKTSLLLFLEILMYICRIMGIYEKNN